MSREAFVPSNTAAAAAAMPNYTTYGVHYICANCASKVTLNKGDPVRCKECGHRVLYKERTRRMGKLSFYNFLFLVQSNQSNLRPDDLLIDLLIYLCI